jgi:hypothetical protein
MQVGTIARNLLRAARQATVNLLLAVYSEPSSSFQVKTNSPDSAAL